MTTDLFDDLGERLDRLAAAQAPDLSDLRPGPRERGRRVVALIVASVAASIIVVVALRTSADVETELPATSLDPSELPAPTFGLDQLPDVFEQTPGQTRSGLRIIDEGTARIVEFDDGAVTIGMSNGHLLCATIELTSGSGSAAGGAPCVSPAAYLSSRVGITGWLRWQNETGDATWFAGLVPLDTTRVLVDEVEATVIDGVYLHPAADESATVVFEFADGTAAVAPPVGSDPTATAIIPRSAESATGSRLQIDDQPPLELSAVGCIRHEFGWDVFAGTGRTWISLEQSRGVSVVIDGAFPVQTTSWDVRAVEHNGSFALDLNWETNRTEGRAFLVCGDHDADLGIFSGDLVEP